MHINRPVAMQMGQMGPDGSNNAPRAWCSSLLLLDLAVSQPRKAVDALMLSLVLSGDDIPGRKR